MLGDEPAHLLLRPLPNIMCILFPPLISSFVSKEASRKQWLYRFIYMAVNIFTQGVAQACCLDKVAFVGG